MPKKIDPKVKERCVQQMLEHVSEYPNPTAAAEVVAKRSGVGTESVRRWYLQAQIDSGQRRGATTQELAEIKDLKAKVRRLQEDNDILRRASIFFASMPLIIARRGSLVSLLPHHGDGLSSMCGVAGCPGRVAAWLDRSLPLCSIEACPPSRAPAMFTSTRRSSHGMVMIGTDSHKRTHTVVAVDEVGRRLAVKTVRTNSEGHLDLVRWSAQFGDVTFALEDCRHLTRRLEADLLAAGCRVVRVPTKVMAGARQAARELGKSDPIDAEVVAVAALRYPDLPVAELDGPAREVKLLSDHRHDLVVQRTRIASQVRWSLHELDPDLAIPSRGLRRHCVVEHLLLELDRFDGIVARLTRNLLGRCAELNHQINALEAELRTLVRSIAPTLLAIPGCGVLSAAVIVGETAGVHRFRDKDAFARFTGTAPVPVWSGASKGKVRLNRGGNRSMNCALHMIVVTQARGVGPGKAYLAKQETRGKDKTAALRLLRRQLSDAVFSALRAYHRDVGSTTIVAPAMAQELMFGRVVVNQNGGRIFTERGSKTGDWRTVPVPGSVMAELTSHIASWCPPGEGRRSCS